MTGTELTVGVVGAAGHSGGELCRLLLSHPAVRQIVPASRGDVPFERVHRNLLGCGLEFTGPDELLARAGELDVMFFCTPTGEAMRVAETCLGAGTTVIDLSADFRFDDAEVFRQAHGVEHTAPHLLARAAYGVTELFRDDVRKADLVANPGCYAITAILGLAPLIASGLADLVAPLHISAVNGTTGAGSTPRRDLLHQQVFGSMLPYSLEGHRHGPELEHVLGSFGGEGVRVDLNTAHGNFARGIYLQASVPVQEGMSRTELLDLYRDFYGPGHEGQHFVLVNDFAKSGGLNTKEYDVYPSLAAVRGSNYCHVGVDYDPRHGLAKVVAVTDNLVKGAAGSAIQNMNVALGLDETAGLRAYGC